MFEYCAAAAHADVRKHLLDKRTSQRCTGRSNTDASAVSRGFSGAFNWSTRTISYRTVLGVRDSGCSADWPMIW